MKHSVLSMVRKSQSHEFMSTLVMNSSVFMSDLNRAFQIELVLPSRLLSISPLEGAKVADSGGIGVGRVHRPLQLITYSMSSSCPSLKIRKVKSCQVSFDPGSQNCQAVLSLVEIFAVKQNLPYFRKNFRGNYSFLRLKYVDIFIQLPQ